MINYEKLNYQQILINYPYVNMEKNVEMVLLTGNEHCKVLESDS